MKIMVPMFKVIINYDSARERAVPIHYREFTSKVDTHKICL